MPAFATKEVKFIKANNPILKNLRKKTFCVVEQIAHNGSAMRVFFGNEGYIQETIDANTYKKVRKIEKNITLKQVLKMIPRLDGESVKMSAAFHEKKDEYLLEDFAKSRLEDITPL